jgi:putative oxidoreductase
LIDSIFAPWADLGPLVLRLGLAIVFFAHGLPKIKGVPGVAGFFKQLNIPMPGLMAWVVAILETFGAVLLALGLGTRVLALLFAFTMLVAIYKAKIGMMKSGFTGQNGWELEFVIMVGALGLLFTGAGAYSLDSGFGF